MQAVARRATKLCLLSDGLPSLRTRYAYDDFGFQRAPYVSECMFVHTCFSSSRAIKGTGHVLKKETGGRLCLRGIFAAVMGRTDFLGRYVVQQLSKMSFQGFASLRGSEDLAIQPKLIGKFGQRRCFASMDKEKANDNHVEGSKETISVTFVNKDGEEKTVQVPIGMSMLEAAHHNDIELEGACEGSLACSTCHVIVMDDHYYNKLQEPTDEENDMLDLAFGLTETSRLGCQVIANPELDGMRLALPAATRNFAVDGYVPKPH